MSAGPRTEENKEEAKGIRSLAKKTRSDVVIDEAVDGRAFLEKPLNAWADGYKSVGFQGSNLFKAIEEVRVMKEKGSKIFLGYTSNLVSSGIRDLICYLVRNKFVHVLVTTAGGIEEDLIKTMKPSLLADFNLDGATLRDNGLNRVGNILIPNENYFAFEGWLRALLDGVVEGKEQEAAMSGGKVIVTPSQLIKILGREIGKEPRGEESICYWAYKNDIPIYCPAITDGSIGDIITYYPRIDKLVIDIVGDIARVNSEALFMDSTGAIVLGAGVVKHHILNANLFRDGLDHCVLINTAQEYDGSDAGAEVDEAVSWGKVKSGTRSVKVHCDATIAFPIIVSSVWPPAG